MSEHDILLMVQRKVTGLEQHVSGLVIERDALKAERDAARSELAMLCETYAAELARLGWRSQVLPVVAHG